MNTSLPSISIVVPTYNEERHIKRCLDSIFKQDYPKKLLEVFVVDNYSEDKTLGIAKKYPVTIVMSKIKNNHISKMIAFKRAKGELFYYMDADLEFKYKDYLKKLVHPLLDDLRIVGASGKVVQIPGDTSLNRFLTYETHQRDPVLEYFSPSVYSTVVEKRQGYLLCKYSLDNIPPLGRCLFWRRKLLKTPIAKAEKFLDLDNLVFLVKEGLDYYAFVPEAEEYHYHVQDLKSLLSKRLRNIRHNFIPHYETREYTWFNLKNKKDVMKIIIWVIYAHLILPALIRGCIKAVKYGDLYCIWYEPLLTLVLTDISVYGFIGNRRGIEFIRSRLFHL